MKISQVQRSYSTEFKERAIQRIEAGERLGAVAAELGIRRKLLYEWRAAYRALGAAGLNRKRGSKLGRDGGDGDTYSTPYLPRAALA